MTGTHILGTAILIGGSLMLLGVVSAIILEWRLLCQRLRERREDRKASQLCARKKARLRVSMIEVERYVARCRGKPAGDWRCGSLKGAETGLLQLLVSVGVIPLL